MTAGSPLEALEKSLAAGLKPVYCLAGPQPFQLELARRKIVAAVPLGAMGDLNSDSFYVGQDDVSGVPRLANTLPMMAKNRLVVLHDWHKAKAKDAEALTAYCESPADFTVLILLAEKFDGRAKLVKLAKKHGVFIEFERLYESRMRPWIAAIADTQGVKLTREAIEYLTRAVGPDLAAVAKEIEKAALHAGGDRVDVDNLAAVMAAVKEQTFYELFDAVAERKTVEALRIGKEMVEQGQSPLAILAMLGRTLRQLTVARRLLAEKIDEGEAARVLGLSPWLAQKTLGQAKAFSGVALREQLLELSRIDLALKDGRSHERIILERLILSLCRRR